MSLELEYDNFEQLEQRLIRMEEMTHRAVTMWALGPAFAMDQISRNLTESWKDYCIDYFPQEEDFE